jgi:tRNA nucleotidyltransferase (CCA-adding enzyme)
MHVYLVGGSVRDAILGIDSKDLDYVMPCSYLEMIEFLKERECVLVHEKPEFLTCKVKFPGKTGVVDFTCCRKESDYDGRRPGKTEIATIEEDLARRDFTVNSIAVKVDENFELTSNFLDPFHGRIDLKAKRLKFV